jgi:hypothetical protein
MAGLSLVVKVQGTPDMATVHDEMRTIHTEPVIATVRRPPTIAIAKWT